jgi:hypothetical protein
MFMLSFIVPFIVLVMSLLSFIVPVVVLSMLLVSFADAVVGLSVHMLSSLCNQIRVWDCVCMFILTSYLINELVNNNSTKYEPVWFWYKRKNVYACKL